MIVKVTGIFTTNTKSYQIGWLAEGYEPIKPCFDRHQISTSKDRCDVGAYI
ncbi:MAG: hypothetical protein RMJ00_02525 [Nitrososphaerota archaeon]|nr:hypothetical protein [Nitrososphaerota archaeon]